MSQTFNELRVYKIAFKLAYEIEELSCELPKSEFFRESDQILRSSKSIVANIAEGFAKRIYPKEFIRYLNIALGSSDETQAHLYLIFSNNLLNEKSYPNLIKDYKNLSVRILNYVKAIEKN